MATHLQSLSITIIGGGIGGLANAIFLAQDGHRVTVLERREKSHDDRRTGGVALFNNSISIFQKRKVWDRISAVADAGNAPMHTRYDTGEVISVQNKPFGYAMVHRADLLRVLYELAIEAAVDIRFQTSIASIQDQAESPSVKLVDGTILQADLLVGADGISSHVRRNIFPDCKPQLTPSAVMLVDIPEPIMQSQKRTMELWQESPYRLYFAPGRSIVSWTVTNHNPPIYHLQMNDHEYSDGLAYFPDPDPSDAPFVTFMTDTSGLCRRWGDCEPGIQHIVKSASGYTKWKIAELPPLLRYSSETGRIVLLGDAAHAVQPFAGQGANMSIEDAECLASSLKHVRCKGQVKDAVNIYDSLRVPRLAGLRHMIEVNVKNFSLRDPNSQQARDQQLANSWKPGGKRDDSGELEGWKYEGGTGFAWLESYETDVEVHKAWREFEGSAKQQSQS